MTREEAIRVLRKIKENLRLGNSNLEALDIAIESLEKDGRPTNLDIYLCDSEDDTCLCLYENTYEDYIKATNYEISYLDWLQQPYEEKPKYKLTEFEYDLLDALRYKEASFGEVRVLTNLQSEGYFEGINGEEKIRDILDNCEVIEECDYWMPIPEWSDNE